MQDYNDIDEIILGDDGEEIINEKDPCDLYHEITDSMTAEELKAWRDKLNSLKRIDKFMESRNYANK